MTSLAQRIDWEKCNGMVPAIVQHAITGRVLMLGYMDRNALLETETGSHVTFFSRTKNRLWTKGESSGNKLELIDIELDCDGDTLLVHAKPHGPTCHKLLTSCFDAESERHGFGFIGTLESIIVDRAEQNSSESYTAALLQSGVRRIAQKIGEEGVEVALAASGGKAEEVISESADLLFHLLVLLNSQGLEFSDVANCLAARDRRSNGCS